MLDFIIQTYVAFKNFFICRRKGLSITKDVSYGDHIRQQYDIFHKKDIEPRKYPFVIFIHGGGWRRGDKRTWEWYACEMAQRGYIAISMNYRLAPEATWQEMNDDVNEIIKLSVNSYDVTIIGSSAGAHLAAWAGFNTKVKRVIPYSGPYDLEFFLENDNNNALDAHELMKGLLGEDITVKKLKEASPITHLDETKYYANSLFIHGHGDDVCVVYHAIVMNESCIKNKKKSERLLLTKGPHGFEYFPLTKDAKQAWKKVLDFIEN